MIIIGEKLNGSIPSVAKAIAEKDADLIRERARMQAEAGCLLYTSGYGNPMFLAIYGFHFLCNDVNKRGAT